MPPVHSVPPPVGCVCVSLLGVCCVSLLGVWPSVCLSLLGVCCLSLLGVCCLAALCRCCAHLPAVLSVCQSARRSVSAVCAPFCQCSLRAVLSVQSVRRSVSAACAPFCQCSLRAVLSVCQSARRSVSVSHRRQLNGIVTQDENIADNGGLRLAYRAWNRWKRGPQPRLPDVPLSPRQLFWVTAANVWCSADRLEHLRNTALNGEHVPARFRINGPLSNMAEFAADFGCRPGAPMNPAGRCRVW